MSSQETKPGLSLLVLILLLSWHCVILHYLAVNFHVVSFLTRLLYCTELAADASSVQTPDEIFEQLRNAATQRASEEPVPSTVAVMSTMITVRHVPGEQVFTVTGQDGAVHACRLFPTESCTCPCSTVCCHIIAAKRSIGLEVTKRRIVNLSTCRRNARFIFSLLFTISDCLPYLTVLLLSMNMSRYFLNIRWVITLLNFKGHLNKIPILL